LRRLSRTRKDTVIVRPDIRPENRLLTPSEVAALFRVDPKTVTRWAQQGKLHSIRTLGGHRRYSEAEIQAFLDEPERVPLPRAAGE
jgi:excisionase family DNA binding protein